MHLIAAALGFLARKLGIFLVAVLSLFAVYLIFQATIPSLRAAVAERDRLEVVIEEQKDLKAELADLKATEIKRRDEICGFVAKAIQIPLPGNKCKDAQRAVDAIEKKQREAAQRLEKAQTEEEQLRKAQGSGVGWVVSRWLQNWEWLLGAALVIVLAPPLGRIIGFWVLMPLVTRAHKRIHLAAGSASNAPSLECSPAVRTLPIPLALGEVLSARSEHVRPVRGKARSQLLYDWSAPFISFAAGLTGLSRITGDESGTEATLAVPDDPNAYLMRIDFTDHSGLVMHPKHVVGVIGTPELVTAWRWGIQSFATWQVRYIMFAGTGSLIVRGSGDVATTIPGDGPLRMEQHLVMGFDSRLIVGVNRTEVFWPYLRGKTPLVDDEFTGPHPIFWQKSSSDGASNPVAKLFNTFFSSIGKILGF